MGIEYVLKKVFEISKEMLYYLIKSIWKIGLFFLKLNFCFIFYFNINYILNYFLM